MLYQRILAAANKNANAMELLIKQFQPLLHKYACRLHTEDAEQNITLFFLELMHHIPVDILHPHMDGKIINYISKALHNYYIHQAVSYLNAPPITYLTDVYSAGRALPETCVTYDSYNNLFLGTIKELLSATEYDVIESIYFHQYSVAQVAQFKNISRQAVNQTRLRALRKLKQHLYS